MIPFEDMEQDDSQRALELVVLLVSHVIQFLGNIGRINLHNAARPQQGRLLHRPAVEVLVIAGRLPPRASLPPRRMPSIIHVAGSIAWVPIARTVSAWHARRRTGPARPALPDIGLRASA